MDESPAVGSPKNLNSPEDKGEFDKQQEEAQQSNNNSSSEGAASPRILLEGNQQKEEEEEAAESAPSEQLPQSFSSSSTFAVAEAFAEVPSVPSASEDLGHSVPSNGEGGGEEKQQKEEGGGRRRSSKTVKVEEAKSSRRPSLATNTHEKGEEALEKRRQLEEEKAEGQQQQQQKQQVQLNWHQNSQDPKNHGKKKIELPHWLNWMLESVGMCKCLGPSSSNGDGNKKVDDGEEKPFDQRKRSFLFFNSGDEEKQRIVKANDRQYNAQFKYADNFIRTSKYTLLTFIPCNLYMQFTRIANFYFLILLGLQCIPVIASVHWIYTLFPLSFVLLCSAIKEGYDDLQRHQNDKQVNTRISYVVRNSRLAEEEWMNVKVGDIIRMENEHFIAADLLLLSSSEPHGLCYIETAELDGETNLKTRAAVTETVPLDDILADISHFDGKIICEPPNNRLDNFEGRLEWRDKAIPLDNKNMLLRGCRLQNTRWCYGLVVFAGKDTKLMKNSGEAPMKRTSLDRFLNLLILGIVLFLLAMCLICAVMTGFWEQVIGRHFRVFLPWDTTVVPHLKKFTTFQLPSLNQNDENEEIKIAISQVFFLSALQFFSYMILLNTVVPISLYISVEMIRLAHSKLINNDLKMYDEKTDTPARARTSTLNEELGQVQYVFSDKTGTLTQNIMVFKKCSINGRSYGDMMTEMGEIVDIDEAKTPGLDFSWNRWHEPNFRFYDKTLMDDTKMGMKEVQEFWRLLAICHTVMPERKQANGLDYQAQSPDEAALTSAARNFGFVFKSRTPQSITVEVNGKEEVYEMLHILDFDNVRKRMSVIVRAKNGKIKLYCKGADTMVLERISAKETSELLRSATLQHLDKFATDGLRTLCVAAKNIEGEYCEKWMERLKEARLDTANKERRVDELYEEIERDMVLLGATAIEDKLQDGVPQTIATLAAANIKLWVLTGDKTETAINIGYSCRLLTDDMREVFIIDGKDEKEVEVQLKDIKRRIQSAKVPQNSMGVSSFYLPPRTPICELSPMALDASPGGGGGGNRPKSSPAIYTEQTTFPVNDRTIMEPAECDDLPQNGMDVVDSPRKWTSPTNLDNNLLLMKAENGGIMPNGNGTCTYAHEEEERQEEQEAQGTGGYALVINGDSLGHALKRKYEKTFLEIGCSCLSVICCRVTPLQKAQVVDLVKRNIKAVTLSIGDGANDVNMIRTAHIGVGISGQEGMQAVLASDFSIGQFRYLERLLLVHGRWSYLRMCKFLRYFFYKNFAFTLTHFWYSFFCGFSAQTVIDPVLVSLYNLFFTALPVLFMGIFDQDVSDTYSLRFPRLYIPGQFNLFFNMRIFIYSIIHGMISSIVFFFIPFCALFHGVNAEGRDQNDYAILAFTCFTALVIVVNGQIAFDTSYWTWLNWFVVLGSLGFYFVVVFFIYQIIPAPWLNYVHESFIHIGVVYRAFTYPIFWLSLMLICAILLLPVIGNRFFWFDTHPSYADRLRVRYRLYGDQEEEEGAPPGGKQFPRTAVITRRHHRRGSLRSGYAFSHASGFGELIAKGTMFKNLENLRIPSFHRHPHHSHSNGTSSQLHPSSNPNNGDSSARRFSLLKPMAAGHSTIFPSLFGHHQNHQTSSNASSNSNVSPVPPPAASHRPSHSHSNSSPILLTPSTLTISNNGTSSITQFSPGSSNTTTTTTLMSNANGNGRVGDPMARRGTVDSFVIEHDNDNNAEEQLEYGNGGEGGETPPNSDRLKVVKSVAILIPLRVPSPDLRNTAHNLVINADMDEEKPLPSNWQYNPDGTLDIPEQMPGKPPATPNKTFVGKKRRETHSDSLQSGESGSSGNGAGGGGQKHVTVMAPSQPAGIARHRPFLPRQQTAPSSEFPPKAPRPSVSTHQQQQQQRVFTGKKRPTIQQHKTHSTSSSSEASIEPIKKTQTGTTKTTGKSNGGNRGKTISFGMDQRSERKMPEEMKRKGRRKNQQNDEEEGKSTTFE